MAIIEITSLRHPGVEVFSMLTEAQLRHRVEPSQGVFIAESPKVIRVALDAGYEPLALLCERKHIKGDASDIISRCGDIPVYTGSRELLASLTGYTLTRGVLCAMRRRQPPTVGEVCGAARRVAVIHGVVDTTNVGAIFRSAAALGIDAVLLTPDSCDPLNRRAVRVSMGSVFLVPWTWLPHGIGDLRDWGFKTAAMALTDQSIPLDDPVLREEPRLAIVMGTEGDGLPHDTIAASDYVVRIPMSHHVDSLNVAAAAAVAFWQLRTSLPTAVKSVLLFLLCMVSPFLHAQEAHWGMEVKASPGRIMSLDSYTDTWLQDRNTCSLAAELKYVSLPKDSDDYAADFGYPVWGVGVRYSMNHGVTMHKYAADGWNPPEASYDTQMGNIVTVYGSFERALWRSRRWQLDYALNIGVGWSHRKYNPVTDVDNELIGSRWLIFFGAGAHATYRVSQQWGLRAGVEFCHHSNGSLNKPNKGANALGPVVGVVYEPYARELREDDTGISRRPFQKYWYANVAVGLGGKTIIEDWNLTAYETPEGGERFRTDKFKVYPIYTLQADVMRRYARRWASGGGIDVFYGSHYKRVKEIEDAQGLTDYHHSPWSLGVAAKHEVFWHDLSMAMSLGFYLKRSIGNNADIVEKPYYERIGLRYAIRPLGGITVGANVAAHLFRADFTEVVVGYPLWRSVAARSGQR